MCSSDLVLINPVKQRHCSDAMVVNPCKEMNQFWIQKQIPKLHEESSPKCIGCTLWGLSFKYSVTWKQSCASHFVVKYMEIHFVSATLVHIDCISLIKYFGGRDIQ